MTAPSFNIGDDVTVTNDTNYHVGDGGRIYEFTTDDNIRVDLFANGTIETFTPDDLVRTIDAVNTPVAYHDDHTSKPVSVCGTPSDAEEEAMRHRMARDLRAALRAIGIHISADDAASRIDVLADKRGWTA